MPKYRLLKDIELSGKRVLLRAGFDVPMENGIVEDASRIEALVPTMRHILDHGASLVLMAHQGRPKGKVDLQCSQKPIVAVLEKLLKTEVSFAQSPTGPATGKLAKALQPGQVLLLENLRFDPREEGNDASFAGELAGLANIYVNDAFTNCHRKHASMVGVPTFLPSCMGLLLEQEVSNLSRIIDDPRRPLTLIISGAKMETKVPVVRQFLDLGDDILLGGAIANTFIAARGFDVGTSKHEPAFIEQAQELMLEAQKEELADIHLPRDVVVATDPESSESLDLPVEDIEGDMSIFDIGTVTAGQYASIIEKSGMIVWNGPMGLYESERFASGSKVIAQAVAAATKRGTVSIIGGGDTIDLHKRYGLPLSSYTFVSTAGGAMLEFISGAEFPALKVLVS